MDEKDCSTFKDLTFTTSDVMHLMDIPRNETRKLIHSKYLNAQTAPRGSVEKFIISWDDLAKIRGKSKRNPTLTRKIKTFSNAKGGVGKSALATSLVHEACCRGYKVLAIDLDPQSQFTYNLGLSDYEGPTLRNCLSSSGEMKKDPLSEVVTTITPLLDIVPSEVELNGLEFLLKNRLSGAETILKKILSSYVDSYDLIVIDTNPYLTLTLANALVAADHVIIPALTDFNSHRGLKYMMQVFGGLFDSPEKWPFVQIAPNGFDTRNNISKESLAALRENFKDLVMEVKIRLSTDMTQAYKLQQSVRQYKKASPVYDDIILFADEVLQ